MAQFWQKPKTVIIFERSPMKKLKLSATQKVRMEEARRHASTVLQEIKAHKLEGEALEAMKALEVAVQNLEAVCITAGHAGWPC